MIFIGRLYKITIMKSAKEEIEEIKKYISDRLQEPAIARKTIQKITKEISDLRYMPRKYKLLKKNKNIEIHRMSVKNYVIIYQVDIKIKTVYILHIFNSKRNYLKLI
ncbi:MAG: type II toxin-antitoxin system RelE/ParE family toxin [Clostridia bacterium]|nr:type II toxin-antitoxin system RelE/ParE family toxin [Clostridia bacterium]